MVDFLAGIFPKDDFFNKSIFNYYIGFSIQGINLNSYRRLFYEVQQQKYWIAQFKIQRMLGISNKHKFVIRKIFLCSYSNSIKITKIESFVSRINKEFYEMYFIS